LINLIFLENSIYVKLKFQFKSLNWIMNSEKINNKYDTMNKFIRV
jgi:hypothetical protein